VLAALGVIAAPSAANAQAAPPPPPPLRSVPLGTAVRLSSLLDNATYRDTFLSNFDSMTPENELKMAALEPHRGKFDFTAADQLVQFALDHGKTVRGHALIWGQSLPLWVVDHGATDDLGLKLPPISLPQLPGPLGTLLTNTATALTGWRRDDLLAVMENHIRTVVQHFAGKIEEWDVVNEPMADDGSLAPTVWERFIGPDYIDLALRTAHAADPQAKLFINDYAVEGPGRKLDGLVNLVTGLLARGVPLDGVGLQMHTHIAGFLDEATIANTMRRFASLGLKVEITEMDVGTSLLDVTRADKLARQAQAYSAAAQACDAVVACTRFTTWGFTDAVSWLGAGESGLLFDRHYRPKPAYAAVRSAFASPSAPVVLAQTRQKIR
jgi:endo-1,4-beta-xylanase